jgi:hypothetical protein
MTCNYSITYKQQQSNERKKMKQNSTRTTKKKTNVHEINIKFND